jgi:hypothetical protein
VEKLWIAGGNPVHPLTAEKKSHVVRPHFDAPPGEPRASYWASLVSLPGACKSSRGSTTVTHRYEQQIAGRTYHIEVRPVSKSRWRAEIMRLPGMPTSMMPFYGTTPEEAAQELSRWLSLVYNGTTRQ